MRKKFHLTEEFKIFLTINIRNSCRSTLQFKSVLKYFPRYLKACVLSIVDMSLSIELLVNMNLSVLDNERKAGLVIS